VVVPGNLPDWNSTSCHRGEVLWKVQKDYLPTAVWRL